MKVLDGRLTAKKVKTKLKEKLLKHYRQYKTTPGLRVILVGEDSASRIYVQQKIKQAQEVGIDSKAVFLPADVSFSQIKGEIQKLNQDPQVHAFLIQLPLPASLSWKKLVSFIDPRKDVDCLTPENQGLLWSQRPRVKPCTPSGIIRLLKEYQIPLEGKTAVVVGRSLIVGLPMSCLLIEQNATVTVCHSYTTNLSQWTKQADIVIVATGQPAFLGKEDFKKGAIVIDVGIHRDPKTNVLRGDVRLDELQGHLDFATPVPGGVGPMTVATLLENAFQLFTYQNKIGEGSSVERNSFN